MNTKILDQKLDQVEIKQTSPIRFKDDAINKIRKQNIVWNKRTDIFIPFKVSKDSHQKGLKLRVYKGALGDKETRRVFYVQYWFGGKARKYRLGDYSQRFGKTECDDLLKEVFKSHTDPETGFWIKDPNETRKNEKRIVKKPDTTVAKGYTINEVIEAYCGAELLGEQTERGFSKDKPIITVDGNKYLNSYRPHTLVAEKGDVSLLYGLLNHVFNNNKEYINHFLDFISYPLQHPGAKMRHALIIVSTSFQFGKGTLWRIIGEIYGENSKAIDVKQALDKSKGYAKNSQMVLIDELQSAGTWAEIQSLLNDLKRIITEKEVSSRELYKDYSIIKTCANYILFSNNKNALLLKPNEVRYWVYITEKPRAEQEFYNKIHNWLDNVGAKAILHELNNREISKTFDPNAIAPKTPFLNQMSTAGEHPITQIIRNLYDEMHTPFIDHHGKEQIVIGSKELFDWLRNNRLLGKARINDISNALEQIGARNLGQCRIKVRNINAEDFNGTINNAADPNYVHQKVYKTSKPTLYLLQKHDELFGRNPQDIADEFYKPINTSPEYPYSGNY